MMRSRVPARGFALVAALFLLTIAAAVGTVMMRKLQTQNALQTSSVSASRARHAADAGIAWAEHRIVRSGNCVNGTLNLREAALRGYVVTVTCARTVHGAGLAAKSVYRLAAQAQYGIYGTADYAAYRKIGNLTQ